MSQVAEKILMVRPAAFAFNNETSENNFFQNKVAFSTVLIQSKALREFDEMVAGLRKEDINVLVIEDTPVPQKPDAIFPNN